MSLEVAILNVRSGAEHDFETAFAEARPLIAASDGFRSLQLRRCEETPNRYLLLVDWETTAHHTEGFRKSARYARWRELLHHFYDPFPVVEHYGPTLV